jgi:hypothetical protein
MAFVQPLAPLADSPGASAAIVIIPIIALFGLLFVTRVAVAAAVGLAGTIIVACGACLPAVGARFLRAPSGVSTPTLVSFLPQP